MLADIKPQIEHMLQGIAYWMAYKRKTVSFDLKEVDFVTEAVTILESRFSKYYVKKEVNYSDINSSLPKQFADLGVFSRADNKCICIIEFKLGNNFNYTDDIQKVNQIKVLNQDITYLVIIVYKNNCTSKVPQRFVTNTGKAKRVIINIQGTKIKVRRVCNALASKNVSKMKKVVCLEVI